MKKLFLFAAILTLSACASVTDPDERMELTGHMNEPAPAPSATAADIPPVVQQVPIIAAPEPVEPLQTFTVVATDLPASELLFALAGRSVATTVNVCSGSTGSGAAMIGTC